MKNILNGPISSLYEVIDTANEICDNENEIQRNAVRKMHAILVEKELAHYNSLLRPFCYLAILTTWDSLASLEYN